MSATILAIESSCDDTSAAIIRDGYLLSNLIANQDVHRKYGGVVPELASRAHQANIIPVVDQAIRDAGISKGDIDAVAFTRGPGLLGSLLVGASFAKGFALAGQIPLIEVNHLKAHVLSHWIRIKGAQNIVPDTPFLCLLVSGGHTQLLVVRENMEMEEIGSTIDDAAGEAFDKCAKVMGLPYPGGPLIDKNAAMGNPDAFKFTRPRIAELDYSFSGLKTNFLYFLRDKVKVDEQFIE
jgi:N6-L-threonylcarbamoyladenine synthase